MKVRRSGFWLLAGILLLVGVSWLLYRMVPGEPELPVAETLLSERVSQTAYKLWNLSLGGSGRVYGSRKNQLYRIQEDGLDIEALYRFDAPISGIFERDAGLMLVATDAGRWRADLPCRLYRSRDGGQTFELVKTLQNAVLLWWSMTADQEGRLFLGEYGPQQQGMSKNVWRSDDQGDTWRMIFQAPDIDKVHIHRVAVDPLTQDVWLTVGDGKNRRMWVSHDHGDNWEAVGRYQATAVAFTSDAIYWGRDSGKSPGLLRYDRHTKRFKQVFSPRRLGNYGGSVYDMAIGRDGALYVPFMKYPRQPHVAAVWRVPVQTDKPSEPLLWLQSHPGEGAAMETIAGPDAAGFLYMTGYRIDTRM